MRMDIKIYNHPHLEMWAVLSTGGKKSVQYAHVGSTDYMQMEKCIFVL